MGEWGEIEAKNYSWPKIADQILDFYQLCQKNKQDGGVRKSEQKPFFIDKIVHKVYNKDILKWLKPK